MIEYVRDPDPPWSQSSTLEDYVRKLIDEGKRSQSEEFQTLFRVFGEHRIRDIATKYVLEKRQARGET